MYENIKLFAESGRPLEVRFVGETVCDGKYRISRSCSDLNSLEYIVDGAGTLEINGQVLYPKAGDVFLLTEGSRHTYYADQNHPWHKYFISLAARWQTACYAPICLGTPTCFMAVMWKRPLPACLAWGSTIRIKTRPRLPWRRCCLAWCRAFTIGRSPRSMTWRIASSGRLRTVPPCTWILRNYAGL